MCYKFTDRDVTGWSKSNIFRSGRILYKWILGQVFNVQHNVDGRDVAREILLEVDSHLSERQCD